MGSGGTSYSKPGIIDRINTPSHARPRSGLPTQGHRRGLRDSKTKKRFQKYRDCVRDETSSLGGFLTADIIPKPEIRNQDSLTSIAGARLEDVFPNADRLGCRTSLDMRRRIRGYPASESEMRWQTCSYALACLCGAPDDPRSLAGTCWNVSFPLNLLFVLSSSSLLVCLAVP